MDKMVWNQRQGRLIERSLCLTCWKKANSRTKKPKHRDSKKDDADETSALLVGGLETAVEETESTPTGGVWKKYTLRGINTPVHGEYLDRTEEPADPEPEPTSVAVVSSQPQQPIVLDHHLFDTKRGWRRAESMSHPTLRLRVEADKRDYEQMGAPFPNIMPSYVNAVTDTGAQSCLWGLKDFYRCGFKDSDLIPVKRTIVAANREEINILGAILLRLKGTDSKGNVHTAVVMVYVTPDTQRFYLSGSALI